MWRVSPNLALASSLLPSIEQQLSHLQQQLIAATSRPLDLFYARLGIVNGYFFPQGWGDLSVVNLEHDIKLLQAWPPPGLKIEWKRIDQGVRDGQGFRLYEGRFKTPCMSRIFDALPPESRTARVQLLVPDPSANSSHAGSTTYKLPTPRLSHSTNRSSSSGGSLGVSGTSERILAIDCASGRDMAPAAALHLAATGDQGFGRRLRLAFPLLKQGVSSMVHESPFYGARRPAAQKGSKLLKVSDLLALGWATIYESMNLLHWLTQEGFDEGGLCMAGLSMGGVHACMTAALYPHDVSCAALLAPRSAAVAYCDGALSSAMAWQPLLKELDDSNNAVAEVIRSTAQAVSVMREATYALSELELAWEGLSAATTTNGRTSIAAAAAVRNMVNSTHSTALHVPPSATLPTIASYKADSSTAVAAVSGGTLQELLAPGTEPAAAAATDLTVARLAVAQQQVQELTAAAQWLRAGGLHGTSGLPSAPPETAATTTTDGPLNAEGMHLHQASHQPSTPLRQQEQQHGSQAGGCALSSVGKQLGTQRQSEEQGLDADWKPKLRSMLRGLSELKSLSVADAPMERQKTLRRLKNVLETYTDITRFPVPRRPDAAVFVAATHDAYVTLQSVQQLTDYWAGSEMRVVSGGHVTAFLMHQDKFREAIVDSIQRLKLPPPAAP